MKPPIESTTSGYKHDYKHDDRNDQPATPTSSAWSLGLEGMIHRVGIQLVFIYQRLEQGISFF
jgi:hypothetical protein